jgi:hypothetical protein
VIILKEHSTLKSLCGNNGDETELDMSGKMKGAEDAIMLAAEIIDNAALSTLFFGGEKVNSWDDAAPEPATLKVGMTEADFSSKNLGPAGAIILSAWISHKDKGALTKLMFGDKQVVTMTTEMAEADFRGKLESCEAQIVAAFLPKCT